jgi:2-oxoglutarate dehydrogenase E2 component (dihydrolipoamide succinyltransferase)
MAQIKVPTLGESVSEATVAKWYKKVGDKVTKDELLVELETDKVTLEVNALEDGILSEIVQVEGATVTVEQILGAIGASAAANATPPTPSNTNVPAAAAKVEATKAAAPAASNAPRGLDGAGPAARKLAEETGANVNAISGTGKDGRITKGDILSAPAASQNSTNSAANYTYAAPEAGAEVREKRVRMTKLRQTIAKRLKESQNTAAMLTTFNEIDMTNIMKMRNEFQDDFVKTYGTKLGFMSLFTKAAVAALKELPAVNAEIDGDEIVYKNYYDVGIAVGTPQGLVVPVVRDCDKRNFAQIEQEIARLAVLARDGGLAMSDLTGGTFTITNGGIYGSMLSTPIINPPQSAILGLHNITKRAVVMPDGSIQARDMMYLALSYDHRIIDGREAVTFLVRIKQFIEDPRRLIFGV